MPGINGIEATRQIMAVAPDTVVFLCSTYQLSDLPPDAHERRTAYVNKEELGAEVLRRLWDQRAAASRRLAHVSRNRPAERLTHHRASSPNARFRRWRRAGRSCSGSRGPGWPAATSKPGPSSATSNSSPPDSSRTWIATVAPCRVLGRVLQRLEAAEVDRSLDLRRVATDVVGHRRRRRAGFDRRRRAAPRARPLSRSSGG